MVDEMSVVVSTLAGSSNNGFHNGRGAEAMFNNPQGLAFLGSDCILVADSGNHCVRKVVVDGEGVEVTTFAGTPGQSGFRNGNVEQALFANPRGVAVDREGVVFVADTNNHRIRKIFGGEVSTLAGSGCAATIDGVGTEAAFSYPQDVSFGCDESCLYVTSRHNCIRKVDPYGINLVTTFAGRPTQSGLRDGESRSSLFYSPQQTACYGANILYVADMDNHAVRAVYSESSMSGGDLVATADVTTIAGGHGYGNTDGPTQKPFAPYSFGKFFNPSGIAVDSDGLIYVADTENHRIRFVTPSVGCVKTLICTGTCNHPLKDGDQATAEFIRPYRLLLDISSHTLYVTQYHCVRKIVLPSRSKVVRTEDSPVTGTLSQDLMALVDNKHLSDVAFRVQDSDQLVYSNRALLTVRSKYFATLFNSGFKEAAKQDSSQGVTEIAIKDAGYEAFRAVIVYLTTDQLQVEEKHWKMVCEVLALAERYLLENLKSECERVVCGQIVQGNALELLQFAELHRAERLKEEALRYVSVHLQQVREKDVLAKMPASLLADVIMRL